MEYVSDGRIRIPLCVKYVIGFFQGLVNRAVRYSHTGADNTFVGERADIIVAVRLVEVVIIDYPVYKRIVLELEVSFVVGNCFEQVVIGSVFSRKLLRIDGF